MVINCQSTYGPRGLKLSPEHENEKGSTKQMEATVKERILTIVLEQLCTSIEKLSVEDNWREDLGADSIDDVEMVMILEDEFQINISDEDAENWETIQDAIDFVIAKLDE